MTGTARFDVTLVLAQAGDRAAVADFYRTFSSMCFTLLGLWWVVVQLKFKAGAGDPRRRRHAYAVLLFFLLPGLMTMISAVNIELSLLWRLAFGFTGLLGLGEVALYATGYVLRTPGADVLRLCAAALYTMIVAVALVPTLAMDLGLGLRGQEVESILVSLLVVVGINLAWFGIAGEDEPAPT